MQNFIASRREWLGKLASGWFGFFYASATIDTQIIQDKDAFCILDPSVAIPRLCLRRILRQRRVAQPLPPRYRRPRGQSVGQQRRTKAASGCGSRWPRDGCNRSADQRRKQYGSGGSSARADESKFATEWNFY